MSFLDGFAKRAESECDKYKYLFKKHEARETFDQENEESPKEQKLEEELGVEKQADDRKHNVLVGAAGGALGGATGALVSGHGSAKTLKQHLVHTGKGAAGGALVGAGALALHNWRKHHQKHAVKKIDYDTYEHTPRLSLTGAALGGAAGHAASHYLGLKGTVPRTLARYVLTASAALDGATAVDTLRGIRHKQFVEHGKKHGYMPKMAFYEGFAKEASKLTTKARNALSSDAFVFPQERRYPLNNLNHARNALARSSGKPEEAKVRAAVYSRYPELKS